MNWCCFSSTIFISILLNIWLKNSDVLINAATPFQNQSQVNQSAINESIWTTSVNGTIFGDTPITYEYYPTTSEEHLSSLENVTELNSSTTQHVVTPTQHNTTENKSVIVHEKPIGNNTSHDNLTSTDHQNTTNGTAEIVKNDNGTWKDWKEIFSKNFWSKRFEDKSFTMSLVIPIVVGATLGITLSALFFLCRRFCDRRRRRFSRSRFINKKYDTQAKDDRWMLLDKHVSSDDDETI